VALVEKSLDGAVGTITLNCPEKHNALSANLAADFLEALRDLTDEGARVVVVRAPRGAKVWSAGHDLTELPANDCDPLTCDDPLRRVVRAIKESPTPIIAIVEGGVWGSACEVVMSCDMVVAAEGSTFTIAPARPGVPCDIVGTLNFMQSVGLPIIKEMLFTTQPISADRALRLGLVNQVVPAEHLEDATAGLAAQIIKNPPWVISRFKEQLRALTEARRLNPEDLQRIEAARRRIYESANHLREKKWSPSQVTPMPSGKNCETRANDYTAKSAKPLAVFLANIGTPSDFEARTKYALSFFQAGGFQAITNGGFTDACTAAKGFAGSDARIAVICSSDEKYEDVAEDTAAELKAAGARTVILVGDPRAKEERYREAGVDRFISMKCDVQGMLRDLMIEEECRAGGIAEFENVA
jgi:methylmalonyl-CoA decarboxylase